MTSRYAALTRDELAVLVPELLLMGQMIDRSGMAWCISNFGREEMVQIAIEEWAASSPIYTRRMQRALNFEGVDVVTIFKGMQLDIGAPPQFMDFRYTIHDRWHGEFHLDHCGALLDVEPMGDEYVRGMCHDIEDPTFDATALATNRRCQVRPIHRPPRTPADRHPHCAWTVTIDESFPEVDDIPALDVIRRTRAAQVDLDPIDTGDEGQADYSGPLVSDLDFSKFSHSALVRIADEVCLQMHLLNLSFALAVGARAGTDTALATQICTRQLIGVAGLGAERIHRAVDLPAGIEGAVRVLELHPMFNPAAYVSAEFGPDTVSVQRCAAHRDGAWIALTGPAETRPLQAVVAAIDPHLDVEVVGTDAEWTARVVETDTAAEEFGEVAVAKISGGASFEFQPRKSLPLTVV
ncbi:hypothetical protein [Mycolicibacterium goodii]|uniref:Uncharacterized protein n=1 Tax=Mycolicibacterium goodii TaxID=134601 RepID=A0A0K0X4W6_MYCGD|nr:hypothetical protein AFA91_11445 [Mycolicibacterium goodii]